MLSRFSDWRKEGKARTSGQLGALYCVLQCWLGVGLKLLNWTTAKVNVEENGFSFFAFDCIFPTSLSRKNRRKWTKFISQNLIFDFISLIFLKITFANFCNPISSTQNKFLVHFKHKPRSVKNDLLSHNKIKLLSLIQWKLFLCFILLDIRLFLLLPHNATSYRPSV